MACDSTGRREQADLADLNNEVPASSSHRRPRLFTVREKNVLELQNNLNARWETCTPDLAKSFSAVAYFFGKELYHRLGVPFGLITLRDRELPPRIGPPRNHYAPIQY